MIIFKTGMNHDVAEVNGSDPPMLPGSFLYEKEPGYEASTMGDRTVARKLSHWGRE